MRLPSPAMIVALLALLVALGGSATATTLVSQRGSESASTASSAVKIPAGVIGRLDYNDTTFPIQPGATALGGAIACDVGMRAIGGGAWGDPGLVVNSSYPSDPTSDYGSTAWSAFADNPTTQTLNLGVLVICAKAKTVS